MTYGTVYSPGYGHPVILGTAQARLWRRLDRLIGARVWAPSTVRELAAALGENPGTVSRDLDKLQRLGLAIHDATWGRRGVRLWRVLSPGRRRGLDPKRRLRALSRMGALMAPQPSLGLDTDGSDPPEPVPSDGGGHPADTAPTGAVSVPAGPFDTERCSCGRVRLVRVGEGSRPCNHRPDREVQSWQRR